MKGQPADQEKTGEKLLDIAIGNDSLGKMPNVQATKAKINKWNYIELKNFCTAKETIDKLNRQPTEWEKIFTNHIAEIYKELIKQQQKKI